MEAKDRKQARSEVNEEKRGRGMCRDIDKEAMNVSACTTNRTIYLKIHVSYNM